MCTCASCSRTVTPTGAKGNTGSFSGTENIIISTGASQTLTPSESGSVILPTRANGIDYLLPDSEVGLTYQFKVLTSVTSNDYSIGMTDATEIFTGFLYRKKAAVVESIITPNGTTNNLISMDGNTTGGQVGTVITVTCYELGKWFVEGYTYGNEIIASPFSG